MPINLQDKVDKEINRLFKEGHFIKLQECLDKRFVSPILSTVKKDGSRKMAAEFQKIIVNLLKEFPQANAFIDDILNRTHRICREESQETGCIERRLEITEK